MCGGGGGCKNFSAVSWEGGAIFSPGIREGGALFFSPIDFAKPPPPLTINNERCLRRPSVIKLHSAQLNSIDFNWTYKYLNMIYDSLYLTDCECTVINRVRHREIFNDITKDLVSSSYKIFDVTTLYHKFILQGSSALSHSNGH